MKQNLCCFFILKFLRVEHGRYLKRIVSYTSFSKLVPKPFFNQTLWSKFSKTTRQIIVCNIPRSLYQNIILLLISVEQLLRNLASYLGKDTVRIRRGNKFAETTVFDYFFIQQQQYYVTANHIQTVRAASAYFGRYLLPFGNKYI